MKRLFYILVLLFAGYTSEAQHVFLKNMTTFDDKKLHFGFTLGVNAADFDINYFEDLGSNPLFKPETVDGVSLAGSEKVRVDVAGLTPGFTVGIVTSLRLAEDFDLRFLPGMSFGERKLVYTIPVQDVNDLNNKKFYSIKSTFLDFPLLLKYKSRRMNNQKPYVIFGGAYRIDISKTGKEDLVRLKPFSSYVEAGIGWDYYLQFFRLSTELKFSFGLQNLLDNGPTETQLQVYSNAISRISSNIFTLSFHFE